MGIDPLPKVMILVFILIGNMIGLAEGQSMNVVSSSGNVGDTSVNYTFIVNNVSAITSVTFTFSSWSYLTQTPFVGSTKCYLFNTSLTSAQFPSNEIQCSMSATGVNQSLNITLTNMLNPSSTKPYQINATFSNSSTSFIISSKLKANTVLNYPLTFISYSRSVGASSSSIQLDTIMNNYIDPSTFLSLTYNSTLITISFPNTSNYNVLQNINGSVLISTWTNSYLQSLGGKVALSNIAITNPQAAITYTITGSFYFKQGNVTYNIQTVSVTIVLFPISFSLLTVASPLSYGVLSVLTVSSTCSYTQVSSSNASNPAYVIVDFPSEVKPTGSSDCVTTSSSTCQHTKTGSPYALSNFQVSIGNFTSSSLTFTSYTLYQGSYYSLCKATTSMNITLQSTNPYILNSECDTTTASLANSINLYVPVESAAAGDEVYMTGIQGIITNSWTKVTLSNSSWYKYALTSSNIAASGTISVPLAYNNPNQTNSNLLTQLSIYRGTSQYTYMKNSSLSLCSISTGRGISTYSFVPSSLLTYDKVSISLGLTMQIYDYAWNDYFTIQFNSTNNGKQYFLAGSYLGINPNLTVNGVYCTFSILNDYTLQITLNNNVALPTVSSPTLTINLHNLVNPPEIDSYWFYITTIDLPTGGTKQILTTSSRSLTQNVVSYSISNVYELKNNSMTLNIANSNRLILAKNNASAFTVITIVLPTELKCISFTNNTVTAYWNIGIVTSNGSASGNSTNLLINLGTCYASYFSNSISFTILDTFNSVQSTSTAVSLQNQCGTTCYQCTSSLCTSCFNSTYTVITYFWQNQCYSTCPNGTYTSNGSCYICHSSCQTCIGPLFTNCTGCSQNFTLSASGYCSSVCGLGKYESNGLCLSCHPNCDSCLSYSVCYVCKTSAVLIGTQCQYSSCTSPCLTCLGSLSACTSCSSQKILYQSQCYDACPSGTYLSKSGGANSCATVSQSNTYIPVTITGVILITIIIILRAYSSKKIGNESRRKKAYVQNESDVNYKINILRVASVLYTYLEIIAAIVLVFKNSMYSVGSEAMIIVALGLIGHLLSNVTFLIGYIKIVGFRKTPTEAEVEGEANEFNPPPSDQSKLRFRVILFLSVLFTLRTYKLLSSNFFLDRKLANSAPAQPKKLQQSQNPLSNIINPLGSNKIQQQNRINKEVPKNNPKSNQEEIPSRKPIRSNSLGDEQFPIIQSTNSIKIEDPLKQRESKFSHPFLTYLTIVSIVISTFMILIGSILEILKSQFTNMVFWGVDCLIVAICSLAMTAWDLWIFANLFHGEQHSEMSSRAEVNHTHQNLKQLADFDIKIEPEVKEVKSPKKQGTSSKAKLSQRALDKQESMEGVRSGIKRECDEQTVARHENIPVLKVFDDFDQKDENILNEKKTKKFNTKKRYSSRKINPVSNRRRNIHGQICDDLYINFTANERETQPNATSYFQSRPSVSPNRSLQEESIEVGGEFEDQPPNFADISDIEQGIAEPINISVSSEIVPNPKLLHEPQHQ